MDSTTENQAGLDDFESRHQFLRELLSSQAPDGDLPVLVEPEKQPHWLEQWLSDLLDKWFGQKGVESELLSSIDWQSTLLILLSTIILVAIVALVRQIYVNYKSEKRINSRDSLAAVPQRESDVDYLQALLGTKRYHEAMLLRWRIFQQQQGLQRHTTPLEFCYRNGLADRAPVNNAYRYMFGHVKAERDHYDAFDRWLAQVQGGTI